MNTKNVFGFIAVLIVLLLIAVAISKLGDQNSQENENIQPQEQQNTENIGLER